ncbi:MAG: AbrB/MazE/SpoVT family DNA-binding domain-containing protein [Bacilli bacterium]|nr:AbrB/MazE/SpoVT family DNA-binding domain-containing protein [Bacilli bacterium]
MKSTGIIRKIDELGRIVIPKEIRKTLNIKESEDLEIFIEEDKIILKKYYRMNNFKDKTIKFIEIFKNYVSGTFILTDRENVLYGITDDDKKLSIKYLNTLNERKKILNNENIQLEITNTLKKVTKYIIFPLISDTDLLGSLLYISNEKITDNDIIILNILLTLIKYEMD